MTKKEKEKEEDKKKLTRKEWKAKYGSDTHYYTHNLDKVDLTTGKKVRQIIDEVSKKYDLDPNFLASTLFTEGLDRYDIFKEKSNPFTREDYNSHPVSGMKHLGLDTIGDRKKELIKRGLITEEDYRKDVLEIETLNEKDEKVVSADFKDLESGIKYVGAFIKMENANIDAYIKKNNIEVTPLQRTFFRNVAYNAGIGNAQKMITSYNNKGYLKDDSFIYEKPDKYWEGPYKNAVKRTTAGMGLTENADFSNTPQKESPYKVQVATREDSEKLSTIDPGDVSLSGMDPFKRIREKVSTQNELKPGLIKSSENELKSGKLASTSDLTPRKKITPIKMKTNPPSLDPKIEEQIIANLQLGIPAVESAKDGYRSHNTDHPNPEMQALGKYQFVPKFWWGPIKKFAEKNGYNIKNYDDFLNSPSLQESYFRHYVKNEILPQAQKTMDQGKNPENLTLEEMTMFYHFQSPEVATKAITEGKSAYRESTKKGENGAKVSNISMEGYKEKYNAALETANVEKVPLEATVNPKTTEEIGKSYFNAIDNVNYAATDLTEKEKNLRIQEIQAEFKAKGHIPAVNKYIEKRTEENARIYAEKDEATKKNLNDFLQFGQNIDFHFKKKDGKLEWGSVNLGTHKESERFKSFAKKNNIKVNSLGNFLYRVDPKSYMDSFKNEYSESTGKKIEDAESSFDGNFFDNVMSDIFGTGENSGNINFASEIQANINKIDTVPKINKLDQSLIPDLPKKETQAKTTENKSPDAAVKETATDSQEKETTEDPEINPADSFFSNQRGLMSATEAGMDKANYDASQFKKELPIDAVTGLALGLIGQDQARQADIPLRSEEINGMLEMYVAELSDRARNGLPPEVEAAMKNQFAESFQAGIRANVNASGGDRSKVLGNQGQLSLAQNRGIVQAKIEDYKAKERAFEQYGKAVQYIDAVERNRDIANTTLKQQRGLMQEQEGKQLAAAGFQKLTDELAYQRDNGPGSVMHMYKSSLMQNIFGFDPNMKDDGTGKPGTKSAFENDKIAFNEEKAKFKEYDKKYWSLPEEQRKEIGGLYAANANAETIYGAVDKLHMMSSPNEQIAEQEKNNVNTRGITPTQEPVSSEDPNAWMYNDFGNGISPDGSPAPPPNPVHKTEAEMASNVPKTTLEQPPAPGTPPIIPGVIGGGLLPASFNTANAVALENDKPENTSAYGLYMNEQ